MNLLWPILVCIFFGDVATQQSLENEGRDIRNVRHKFKNITDTLSNSINTLGKFLNPILWILMKNNSRPFPVDFLSNSSVLFPKTVSPICRKHISFAIQTFLTNTKKKKKPLNDWSMKMFDSFAKPPSGIYKGNRFWLGNFWECLEVEVGSEHSQSKSEEQNISSTEIYFTGEYCLFTMKGYFSTQLSVGVCLPNSCTLDDKSHLIAHWVGHTHLISKLNEKSCYTNKGRKMDTIDIIITCCLIGIILFVILGSIVASKEYPGRLGKIFSVISIPKNMTKVFNIEKRNGDIHVLHGIKVLSMAWIILAHCYKVLLVIPLDNVLDFIHTIDNEVLFGTIRCGDLAVDTFFLMSSTLIAYNFLKKAQHFKFRSLPRMFLYHYIRLTPAFMVTVAIVAGPIYYLLQSPVWENVFDKKMDCRKTWWTSLFYIFNFTTIYSKCNGVAWYLAVDMQLFILTSLLLFPLYRKPKWGLIGIGICIVLSLVVQMLVIYFKQIEFIFNSSSKYIKAQDYIKYYYMKPWGHLGQYLVGLILGYLLHTHFNKKKITIKPALCMTAWVTSTVSSLTLLFGTSSYYSGQLIATPTFNVLYLSLSRLTWTINIAWIILACTVGNGGIVEPILSWKYFIPLSKISYSCYIVQEIVIMTYFGSLSQPIHFDHYRMVNIFISILATSLFLGFLLCILFEMPINSISILLLTTMEEKNRPFPEIDNGEQFLKQENFKIQ